MEEKIDIHPAQLSLLCPKGMVFLSWPTFNFSFINQIGNWESKETLPVLWIALFFFLSFLPRSSIQSEGAPLVCILDKQPSIFAVVGLALFSLHGCPGCPLAICLPCLHAVRSLFYLLRVRFMYDVYVWQKCGATVKKKKEKKDCTAGVWPSFLSELGA
ncbi:hypothetical protein B9Z19DRAFT_306545 [Tuber borchii]|uniref:Uncharacterized protein n=1 Tax=Tuber borchii TaxID=42251 RepID=A0A2T6ZK54_TUBBO|nr:hypothetical protein B9Z19DRAFT_306545 [Tuber borchii]